MDITEGRGAISPTHQIETPFGTVALLAESDHEVRLTGDVTVNRVRFALDIRFRHAPAGWLRWGSDFLKRAGRQAVSRAAEERAEAGLHDVVTKWADAHPGELVAAQRAWLMRRRQYAEESVRWARERLIEAEGDVAEIDARLASLPEPALAALEVDEDPVTF